MARHRSPKNERRAEEVMRTMRALASLTEDDWQKLTDEERAEVKAMLADKAWLTGTRSSGRTNDVRCSAADVRRRTLRLTGLHPEVSRVLRYRCAPLLRERGLTDLFGSIIGA
jgi:hypothetical protein